MVAAVGQDLPPARPAGPRRAPRQSAGKRRCRVRRRPPARAWSARPGRAAGSGGSSKNRSQPYGADPVPDLHAIPVSMSGSSGRVAPAERRCRRPGWRRTVEVVADQRPVEVSAGRPGRTAQTSTSRAAGPGPRPASRWSSSALAPNECATSTVGVAGRAGSMASAPLHPDHRRRPPSAHSGRARRPGQDRSPGVDVAGQPAAAPGPSSRHFRLRPVQRRRPGWPARGPPGERPCGGDQRGGRRGRAERPVRVIPRAGTRGGQPRVTRHRPGERGVLPAPAAAGGEQRRSPSRPRTSRPPPRTAAPRARPSA